MALPHLSESRWHIRSYQKDISKRHRTGIPVDEPIEQRTDDCEKLENYSFSEDEGTL